MRPRYTLDSMVYVGSAAQRSSLNSVASTRERCGPAAARMVHTTWGKQRASVSGELRGARRASWAHAPRHSAPSSAPPPPPRGRLARAAWRQRARFCSHVSLLQRRTNLALRQLAEVVVAQRRLDEPPLRGSGAAAVRVSVRAETRARACRAAVPWSPGCARSRCCTAAPAPRPWHPPAGSPPS